MIENGCLKNSGKTIRSSGRLTVKHGFTLIELLVVVSIISLLVSILLPALNKARKQAAQTWCLANLHQMMAGVHTYTMNSDDRLPFTGRGYGYEGTLDFFDLLLRQEGYEKDMAHCPADKRDPGRVAYWWKTFFKAPNGIALVHHHPDVIDDIQNGYLDVVPAYSYYWNCKAYLVALSQDNDYSHYYTPKNWKKSKINYPSSIILCSDMFDSTEAYMVNPPHGAFGHNSGFADGHAAFVPKTKVTPRHEMAGSSETSWAVLDMTEYGILGIDTY